MEWKKLTCPEVSNWEVELPSNFSGGREVTFRCHAKKANITQLLEFLQDVYGVDYKLGQSEPVAYQKEEKPDRTKVKLSLLEGKNLKLITQDFSSEDWQFIRTCRLAEYQTYEEVLLQNIMIKLSESSPAALGDLGNILLEYQQLMKFVGILTAPTGGLDNKTFEAHRKFLKTGLTEKLKFPKDSLVKLIQSVVGAEADGRYGLETWLLVKPHTIGEGGCFLSPATEMPAEKLRETFIPYKLLGSKSREIAALMLEEQHMKDVAAGYAKDTSAWHGATQASEHARKEWDKLLKKQMQQEIAEFNEFVKKNRDKQEEIKRRAQELFKRVFDNLSWYSSEKLVGKTLTEIVKVLGPQTPEDLILDIVLAAITAGAIAYIGKAIIQARRIKRAKRLAALLDDLKLSGKSKKIILLKAKGFSREAAFAVTKYAAQRRQWIASLPRKTRKAAEKAANMAKRWSDDLLRKYPNQRRIAHHLLPEGGKEAKFFRRKFERIFGKDIIDSWQIPLPEKLHPKPVHRGTIMRVRGGWWNAQWKKFFTRPESELTPENVFKHLEKLITEVSTK